MYRKIALLIYVCLSLAAFSQTSDADLSVTKTGPDFVTRTNNAVYTVTVFNAGPAAATNVVINDVIAGDATFVSVTPPTGCTGSTCTVATLNAGAQVVYEFSFLVDSDATGTIENTATVSSATNDPNGANNSAKYTSTIIDATDLEVVKSGPATAAAGTLVTYDVTVRNLGPDAAAAVTLTDIIPAGMTFETATQPTGPAFNCSTPAAGDPGTIVCGIATFNAGAVATFSFVFEIEGDAEPGDSFTNVATVTTTTFELNEENNSANATTTVPAPPPGDMRVSKTGPTGIAPDTDVTYTIVVGNGGPGTATNVTVTDTLPGDQTFVSLSQTGTPVLSCTTPAVGAGGTITCTSAAFPAGGSVTLTLVGHVPQSAQPGAEYANTVFVTSDFDPNEENNVASTTGIVSTADISVVKSGPASVTAAQNISYTLAVTNNGPDLATTVLLRDVLPPGTSFVSVTQSPAGNCTFDGTAVDCAFTLAPGETANITLVLDPGDNTSVTNTATVSTESADLDPSDDSSTVMTTVTPVADLQITKTGSATVTAGTNVSYTVTVTNNGPSPATGIVVSDAMTGDATFVSVTPSAGCTGATCNLASLAAGASAVYTYTYQADADATGTLDDTASVTAATPDNVPGNNSDSVSTTVVASADLSVDKSGPASVTPGGDVSYTVTVMNAGPSTALNVTVNDMVSGAATFVSVTPSAGCTGSVCTIASLAPGASVVYTYTFNVSPSATGTIGNTATVSSTTPDPNNANNTDGVTAPAIGTADVSVTKTGPGAVATGTDATFTIVVANAGPSDAANVTMTDVLPPNTTFVSLNQTGPAFTCTTGATVSCTIATLPAMTSTTFTLVVNVAAGATEPIDNTATVTTSTTDPNAANNSSTATLNLNPAPTDLSITKTANGTRFQPGASVTYTIVVTNNGPATAFGTTVTDVLPAGTTLQSATSTQGTCAGTSTVVCSVGTLAPLADATITLVVQMPFAPATVQNTATVTAANADSSGGNNASTVGLAVTSDIPTVSEWGLIFLAIALAFVAAKAVRM